MLKKWRLKSLTLRKNILLPFEEGIFMAVSNGFLCSYLSSKLKLYYHDRIPLTRIRKNLILRRKFFLNKYFLQFYKYYECLNIYCWRIKTNTILGILYWTFGKHYTLYIIQTLNIIILYSLKSFVLLSQIVRAKEKI